MEITPGHLLGGRVRYDQPAEGFRSGIEPLILAASIPARPGALVLEGGSGAGAALLCLGSRVAGVTGIGIEADPRLALLAARNAWANRLESVRFIAARIEAMPLHAAFDHAFANPPYHPPFGSSAPDSRRETAKRAQPGLFGDWAKALAARLAPKGTLTFILSAAGLAECLEAFQAAGCGSPAIYPLWPRAGQRAKLAVVRAIKGGKGPCQLMAGLVLHQPDGRFTAEADAILRDGSPAEGF